MGGRLGKQSIGYLFTGILALLLVLPVGTVFFKWIGETGSQGFFTWFDIKTIRLIGKSLMVSSVIAVSATVIGTVCGLLLYKTRLKGRQIYLPLLLIPLLVSPYIFAVAWKDALFLLFGTASSIYSLTGVIGVHTLIFFPLAMLITGTSLANINSSLEEAALMETNFRSMSLKILFPLIRPAINISFILILIFSLSDFSVPAFFGVQTFTTEIFTQFSAFYNYTAAISQSTLLALVCLVLILLEARYLDRAPFFSIGSGGSQSQRYSVPQLQVFGHTVLWLLILLSILLPVGVLLYRSFTGNTGLIPEAWRLLTSTIGPSVRLALLGSSVITLTGLFVGYLQEQKNLRLANTILLLTFVLPSIIFGIALILFYNRTSTIWIYSSFLIILIGYLGKFGFIAARITGNGLRQIPPSLTEAGKIMGITSWKRFGRITLPLLLPSLFAAFVLSFVLCLGELGTTIMVYPPGTELMPVKIFTISANAPQALTSSMVLINLAISLLFIGLFYTIGRIILKKYQYA